MPRSFVLFLILLFSASVLAQGVPAGFDVSNFGVRIEPDKRVMIVLATLEAARTTNDAGETVPVINPPLTKEGEKFRELLTSDLAAIPADLRQRISSFVIQHKKRYPQLNDQQLVAPFISMAYALSPAPELADPVVTTDLPGNLLDVLDFAPLVRDFYRRSSMSGNIAEYVKTYQKSSDGRLRDSSREMVSELLDYLHTKPQLYFTESIKTEARKSKRTTLKSVEKRERERRFFLVPEMLAPAGTINFVNVRDDYYAVLPPDTDVSRSEVRRAYLQFVIDAILLNNSNEIGNIRDGVRKLLDERRKIDPSVSPDVFLTVSRSLVAAADIMEDQFVRTQITTAQARQRIDKAASDDEKKAISAGLESYKKEQSDEAAARMSEDYEKGAILVFYFAEQLKGIEGSGFDVAASMRDILLSFDPAKETNRLAQFADARTRAVAARNARKANPVASSPVENPVTTRLIDIQKLVDAKNYTQANAELKLLIEKNPADSRIYYNLGRVASLSAENETELEPQKAKLIEAKNAFEKVILNEKIDKAIVSLSYVALAKIYEFYDNKAYAIALYDKAIQIGNVPGGAHREALDAKARLLKENQ